MTQHYRYGILGYPLAQSLSPTLMNRAFALHHIPASYEKFEVAPAGLATFVQHFRAEGLGGLSVTIPHKQTIIPLLDEISPEAQRIGAVNTVYQQDGKLCGTNTDYTGFLTPLLGDPCFTSSLILGGGGAARAVLQGLKDLGLVNLTACLRNPAAGVELASSFGCKLVAWEDLPHVFTSMASAINSKLLLLNTTPLGMRGKAEYEGKSPLPAALWQRVTPQVVTVYDLVYNPLRTVLLAEAAHAGAKTIDGLAMFCAQAREQFRLWTGLEFDLDWARELCLEQLKV